MIVWTSLTLTALSNNKEQIVPASILESLGVTLFIVNKQLSGSYLAYLTKYKIQNIQGLIWVLIDGICRFVYR